jgi:hypothetical protein
MPKSKPISKKLTRCTNASSSIVLVTKTRQAKEAIAAGQSTPMDYDPFFP